MAGDAPILTTSTRKKGALFDLVANLSQCVDQDGVRARIRYSVPPPLNSGERSTPVALQARLLML